MLDTILASLMERLKSDGFEGVQKQLSTSNFLQNPQELVAIDWLGLPLLTYV